MNQPTPDTVQFWVEIAKAIGALATFGAFVVLFRKDKDKQKQIEELTKIAEQLEGQNSLIKKSNELLSQQLDVLSKEQSGELQSSEAQEKLIELEAKKIRLSAMPRIVTWGGQSRPQRHELQIRILNKGEFAEIKKYEVVSGDLVIGTNSLPIALDKGDSIYFMTKATHGVNTNIAKYEIDIYYTDGLDYEYKIRIKGEGVHSKVISTDEL